MKKLILLFLFLPCLVSAHTLVIGTGSGGFSQSSMGSLSPGDTLAIKAGNYSGSIGLQALTDITVIPYGGNVVITGSNAWQLDNLTNVNITSYNGYSFQFTNCSTDAFYLASACTGLFFNGIQCNNVQGIFLDASSSGSPYVYYGGETAVGKEKYKEGTVIIDLIDSKTHKIVWRGFGVGEAHKNVQKDIEDLPKVVDGIISQLQLTPSARS